MPAAVAQPRHLWHVRQGLVTSQAFMVMTLTEAQLLHGINYITYHRPHGSNAS
jgi:hypothetical protein